MVLQTFLADQTECPRTTMHLQRQSRHQRCSCIHTNSAAITLWISCSVHILKNFMAHLSTAHEAGKVDGEQPMRNLVEQLPADRNRTDVNSRFKTAT